MLKAHFNYVPDYMKEQTPPRQEIAQGHDTQLKVLPSTQLSTGTGGVVPLTTSAPVKTAITISSEPAGAEISIDGQFDSSTPSKVLLPPGEHTIRVTRPGFRPWERKVTVEIGAEKTLNALLEKDSPRHPA
jgi:hypothetical protein